MVENQEANWRQRRERKLLPMLDPDQPAWLVEEEVHEADEVVHYTIVHRWHPGSWARRRYTYDMTSDVIHFRGATPVDEAELVKMKAEQRITARGLPRL